MAPLRSVTNSDAPCSSREEGQCELDNTTPAWRFHPPDGKCHGGFFRRRDVKFRVVFVDETRTNSPFVTTDKNAVRIAVEIELRKSILLDYFPC